MFKRREKPTLTKPSIRKLLVYLMSLVFIATTLPPPMAQAEPVAPRKEESLLDNPPHPRLPRKHVTPRKGERKVTKFTPAVNFSETPTDAQISAARILPEPVSAAPGQSNAEENRAVAAALLAFRKKNNPEDVSDLKAFLASHPNSRFRAALELNIALKRFECGYFSEALQLFECAFECSKDSSDRNQREIAERAISELANLEARLGRMEAAERHVAAARAMGIHGSNETRISAAEQGLQCMRITPDKAFKCGPFAVNSILFKDKKGKDRHPLVEEAQSTTKGTSLAQVKELADKVGLDMQIVKRQPGAEFVVPAVVHWGVGHFGTITEKRDGKFHLQDPTFDTDANLWISEQALEQESDGFFLIPAGPLPAGFEPVSMEVASTIFGKGASTGGGTHLTGPNNGNSSNCDRNCCEGLATSGHWTMLSLLNIKDFPVGYAPPVGPPVRFEVNYTHKEANQPGTFTFSNFGPNWTLNFISYLTVDGSQNATVRLAGGGSEIYPYSSGYPINLISQAELVDMGSGVFERRLPDGSKQVFDQADGSGRIFMTEIVDPQGNSILLQYDNDFRLTTVTDAIGQESTISYVSDSSMDPGFLKIETITDPFNRSANFEYDSTVTNLVKITDTIGLTSQFTYDSSTSFITTMTTPYGTTSFYAYSPPVGYAWKPVGLRFLFPDGTTKVAETWFNEEKSTYIWDRETMKRYPHDPENHDITHCRRTFWEMDSATNLLSDVPYYTKNPLEWSATTFTYPGETTPGRLGTSNKPTRIVRQPNYFSTQTYEFEYNDIGHMTRSIDPVGREFTYDFDTNDIDLVAKRQTRSTNDDYLGQWQDYNSQHLPETYIDGSGQETTYTYNSAGQVLTITDPDSNVTTFEYDLDGYLVEIDGPLSGSNDVTTFAYDDFGRLETVTDSEGYTIEYDYDDADRLVRVTYPDGTFEQTIFDRLDPILSRDRIGRWTHRAYDRMRQLIAVTDPMGRKTQFTWCACGKMKTLTDPKGQTTTWSHDLQGRVIEKKFADNTTITYAWNETVNWLNSMTDALNQTKTYSYNLDETLSGIAYTNEVNSTSDVSLTYDPDYRRISTVTNGWGTITYGYNAYIDSPTASPITGGGMVASITNNVIDDSDITFEYDSLGRVTNRSIDGTNNSIDWVYDEMSRVTTETNALGQFDFAYPDNSSGTSKGISRLASITYPNDQVTNFSYYGNTGDHRLQTIENLDDSSNLISEFGYQYNPAGEITQWTQQRGTGPVKQWNIGYDLAGQLSSVQTVAGTPGPPHINEHFFYDYDLAGNRTSVQTNGTQTATIGGTATASDVLTLTVHDAGLSGGSKAKDYTVQGGDSLSDIAAGLKDAINTDTDLQGIGVSATAADEVISITSISSNATSLSKSLSGGATETITLALKASVKQASHNNVNALTSISAGGATRFLATTNKAVKSATVDAQAATLNHAKQFIGNPELSSGTNSVSVAAVDGGDNQETVGFDVPVDTASSQSLTYDSNGNMTSDGTNSFEWDCENRLIKIVYPGTNNFTELVYDGIGERVKIVETEEATIVATKHFLRGEERNASYTLVRQLFQGGERIGGASYFFSKDHLGSISEVTDTSCDVITRLCYGPHGKMREVQSGVEPSLGFAGLTTHNRSGLYLSASRSYSAELGRWINRDKLGLCNLYSYVGNSPSLFIDPLGLYKEPGSEYQGWRPGDFLIPGNMSGVGAYAEAVMAANGLGKKGGSDWENCIYNCLHHAVAGAAATEWAGNGPAGGGGALIGGLAVEIGEFGSMVIEYGLAGLSKKLADFSPGNIQGTLDRSSHRYRARAEGRMREFRKGDTPVDLANNAAGANAAMNHPGDWEQIMEEIIKHCADCCDKQHVRPDYVPHKH